jgi:predicted TIM-barrel fold metal-dependent hydrolase
MANSSTTSLPALGEWQPGFRTAGMTPAQREKVMGSNAARLLKLN